MLLFMKISAMFLILILKESQGKSAIPVQIYRQKSMTVTITREFQDMIMMIMGAGKA